MIYAAGILFITPKNESLFLLRGNGSDHPNEWCIPGGHVEDGETLIEAAIRETSEECGYSAVPLELSLHTRRIAPPLKEDDQEVDFTTFVCHIEAPFTPVLCDEHCGYAWAPLACPPRPLHPGVEVGLRRFSMVEIDVARAMAEGELTSPQVYQTVTFFAIRITGTGKSYRPSLKEHVWRDPELYLNEKFLSRCNGLPVIIEHPEGSALDSTEFNRRMVGTIVLPYIKGDEVWGIARIMDDKTIKLMQDEQISTSPGVTFDYRSENFSAETANGETILVEDDPSLMDHLALCWNGVWDKGGPPEGVDRSGVPLVVADSIDFEALSLFTSSLTFLDVRMSSLSSRSRANRRGNL